MVSRVEPVSEGLVAARRVPISLDRLRPVVLSALPGKPAVSVLITCYNYGAYVGDAIESALNQSYPPAEIIVSDDGSSDNSCEVIEGYAKRHPRIKLLRNAHGGMAACLNAGYRSSLGEIVCLLDADDVFLPRKLELVVGAFRANPQSGFAAHPALLIDHRGRRRGVCPLGALPEGDCSADTFRNAGVLMGLPPTTNLSLRRAIGDRIFPIPSEFTGYAEQVIHRLGPFMTPLSAVTEALAEWRQHGMNDQRATHVSAARAERELVVMESLWRIQKEYLETIDPGLAQEFPPLDHSALYRKLRYTQARLANTGEAEQRYAELFAYDLGGPAQNWFWRFSRLLPRSIFSRAVDLLMTQSVWKEFLVWLRGFYNGR